MNFGVYLKQKREEKGINLRKFSELVGIAPAYMSDIENGKRNSPSEDKMAKIIEILELQEAERNLLYDLAAQDRENTVAPDISQYIYSNDAIRVALRKAQNLNLGELEWIKIIQQMEKEINGKN